MISHGGADFNWWPSRFQSEDIPVDQYPIYNFVGRILDPRGNSLKRVKANTECRVLIRGHGSVKDPARRAQTEKILHRKGCH
ncbi:hypothetical protein MLD38_012784 [Melastoma candidum]|uniref:Uncharacterized protein n=1 Tax=Melastoma candidum TaxID=119954 RepID=A0ACB9R8Q8_9MYRT|nr:hypothetical protein MLD38_012784 [Melastoma candidum]